MGVKTGASGIRCGNRLIKPRASKSGLRLSVDDPDAFRVSTRAVKERYNYLLWDELTHSEHI